jgi:hypothetical protein
MVALDALLIPLYGLPGAAAAAAAGAGSGFAVCLLTYRRTSVPIRSLLPRPSDFAELLAMSLTLMGKRGSRPTDSKP